MAVTVNLPRGKPGSEESKAYMRDYRRLRKAADPTWASRGDRGEGTPARMEFHRRAQAKRRADAAIREHDNGMRRRRYAGDGSAQRARSAARRARCVDVVHPLVVLELHDGVCGICGEDVDPLDFHVDHIVQLVHGGEHSYENTQPACPPCNLAKNGRAI